MTYLMLPEKPPDECFGPPIDKLLNGKRTFGDAEGYGKFFSDGNRTSDSLWQATSNDEYPTA